VTTGTETTATVTIAKVSQHVAIKTGNLMLKITSQDVIMCVPTSGIIYFLTTYYFNILLWAAF
jgi:hypothetical protein